MRTPIPSASHAAIATSAAECARSPVDVRLVELTLDVDNRRATRDRDLVTGLPTADSGRHSGCRPTLGDDGLLYVGTGDSADPAAPQDRGNLGGKVLRLDPATGEAAEGNPFADADDAREQLQLKGADKVSF